VKYAELICNLLGCDGVDCGNVTYILGHLTLNFLDYPEDESSKLLRNVRNITNQHCVISKSTSTMLLKLSTILYRTNVEDYGTDSSLS
jgi:hypothetical protein